MTIKPIITLTLNPTIDGYASAELIQPLRKVRTRDENYHPGGGGINVARVIEELGGTAHALYLAGGATGTILDELLRATGIAAQRIAISGYTRIAHTVFERSSGQEFRFVPEGPDISANEWDACLSALESLDFDYVVASGSLPRGMPASAYTRVIEIADQKRARVILDTSGPALRRTLERGVFLVKPNLRELEELTGHALPDTAAQVSAARDLIAADAAQIVALTLGSEGALLVSKGEAWSAAVPPVVARSAVGAGDGFVGGVTLALTGGEPLRAALASGVAAGTAAVLSPGAGLSRREDVDRLYAELLPTISRL
ncbi:MAG: 1-phosphofructokinase family hexose kinase [Novosphingobium sp.]